MDFKVVFLHFTYSFFFRGLEILFGSWRGSAKFIVIDALIELDMGGDYSISILARFDQVLSGMQSDQQ